MSHSIFVGLLKWNHLIIDFYFFSGVVWDEIYVCKKNLYMLDMNLNK